MELPDGTGTVCSNRTHDLKYQSDLPRRFKQFPEYGEAQRAAVYQRLERMDHELDGREFMASDRFTIADITALVAIDFGSRLADVQIAPSLAHLTRWHEAVSKRASVKA